VEIEVPKGSTVLQEIGKLSGFTIAPGAKPLRAPDLSEVDLFVVKGTAAEEILRLPPVRDVWPADEMSLVAVSS
jgi:hypothetical protein